MQAGWLDDITNWLREQILKVWDAFVRFLGDLLVDAAEACLEVAALAVESLPVPEFLSQYSLNALLGQAGPTIGWLVTTFRIGECLAIIGLGYSFRRLRKLFTLGLW